MLAASVRVHRYARRRKPRSTTSRVKPLKPQHALDEALYHGQAIGQRAHDQRKKLEKLIDVLEERQSKLDPDSAQWNKIEDRMQRLKEETDDLDDLEQLLKDYNEEVETVVWEGDAVEGLDKHARLIEKLRRQR